MPMTGMSGSDRVTAAMTGLAGAALPAVAAACPLCYGSSAPQVLNAYYLSTAVLSLLPFAIVGVIGLLAVRMLRRAQASAGDRSEPSSEPTR